MVSYRPKKEDVFAIASFSLNGALVLGIMFIVLGIFTSLLGKKLYVYYLIHNLSFIGLALSGKRILKRAHKGLRIRVYERSLACLFMIIMFLTRLSYPANIIISILAIVVFVFLHLTYSRRMKQQEQ